MNESEENSYAITLSICIATFNRAKFIGATLDSILGQLTDECEILILDGASSDETERVIAPYTTNKKLRYVRQEVNSGIDHDYDVAVQLSRGKYCWLFTDDDFLKPEAIAKVIALLHAEPILVLANMEVRDLEMNKVLVERYVNLDLNATYGPKEMDLLFSTTELLLQYIGCVVIKRSVWLESDRKRYYGSGFVHVGVIFQKILQGLVFVLSAPVISYRAGNTHTFSSKLFESVEIKWPSVVWSLAVSDEAKRSSCRPDRWNDPKLLLLLRALGVYRLSDYRQHVHVRTRSMSEALLPMVISFLPVVVVNIFYMAYYRFSRDLHKGLMLYWLRGSLLDPTGGGHFRAKC